MARLVEEDDDPRARIMDDFRAAAALADPAVRHAFRDYLALVDEDEEARLAEERIDRDKADAKSRLRRQVIGWILAVIVAGTGFFSTDGTMGALIWLGLIGGFTILDLISGEETW